MSLCSNALELSNTIASFLYLWRDIFPFVRLRSPRSILIAWTMQGETSLWSRSLELLFYAGTRDPDYFQRRWWLTVLDSCPLQGAPRPSPSALDLAIPAAVERALFPRAVIPRLSRCCTLVPDAHPRGGSTFLQEERLGGELSGNNRSCVRS